MDSQGIDVRHAFAADASGPVTVVFATYRYRGMVGVWIEHARRAGCLNYRIVCMDSELLDALCEEGPRAVYYWDVLPELREEGIDSSLNRLSWLTRLRTKLLLHLVAHGIDFVHSDADAFWLCDPRPWLLDHKGCDLLFSQGTTHPWTHFKVTGFTVCAGFFFVRASARTRAFFEMADRMAQWHLSDQWRFNEILLRDRSSRWEIQAPRLALAPFRGQVFSGGGGGGGQKKEQKQKEGEAGYTEPGATYGVGRASMRSEPGRCRAEEAAPRRTPYCGLSDAFAW